MQDGTGFKSINEMDGFILVGLMTFLLKCSFFSPGCSHLSAQNGADKYPSQKVRITESLHKFQLLMYK